jgi:hypothetical protein
MKMGPLDKGPFAELLETPQEVFLGCSDSIEIHCDVDLDTKSTRKFSAPSKMTRKIFPSKTKLGEILLMNG